MISRSLNRISLKLWRFDVPHPAQESLPGSFQHASTASIQEQYLLDFQTKAYYNMETRNQFRTNIRFVEPLYKKTRIKDRASEITVPSFDRTVKLCGDDSDVKAAVRQSSSDVTNVKGTINKGYNIILPGVCDNIISSIEDIESINKIDCYKKHKYNNKKAFEANSILRVSKMIANRNSDASNINNSINKVSDIAKDENFTIHKIPDTWLRVYAAPKTAEESFYSVVLRCILCQLGLAAFIVIWTTIAVFIVQSFEGPQESQVSLEFEKEQKQLVIDLATELRQITPLSSKWRYAIEQRIEDERQLTLKSVSEGARIKPGKFWNLSGTFLFAIYVMTALGFGAPVPHTLWGRTAALIYAALAIPTHIFLMVNASTCVIVHVEAYTKYLRDNFCKDIKPDAENKGENPDSSRNSELLKSNRTLHKHVTRSLGVLSAGHCVPLATITYYLIGVISFGILRYRNVSEIIMFPLEFTTTGGLERICWYVRVIYGLYVEGAMFLLACVLSSLQRYSSTTFSNFSKTYRLFQTNACMDCINNSGKV